MSAITPKPVSVPWKLRAAVGLVGAETAVECGVVIGRSELTGGLRAGLVVCLSLKWLFAWRALRLGAGGALGVFLLEATTVVAALGATGADTWLRAALVVVALTVIVLLAGSLHAFPVPALPGTETSRTDP